MQEGDAYNGGYYGKISELSDTGQHFWKIHRSEFLIFELHFYQNQRRLIAVDSFQMSRLNEGTAR